MAEALIWMDAPGISPPTYTDAWEWVIFFLSGSSPRVTVFRGFDSTFDELVL
jgi:hypothetical protein